MSADFKLIRPIWVTDAIMNSSTVPEAVAATYNAGTTYALGDRVGLAPVNGSPQTVWESLQNGNTGNALVEGAWWTEVADVYPAYNAGVTYAANDVVSDLANHRLYRSLVGSNLGNALSDATKWEDAGPTNAWAMFDDTYGSQTEAEEEIVIELEPGQLYNSLYLGNVAGASVTVTQSDSGWTETYALQSHPVLDWYSFYYEVPIREESLVITNLPPYPASTLTITISNPGGTAKCGICLPGKAITLGQTEWNIRAGIISYSGTTTDSNGNTVFNQRQNVKRLNFSVQLRAGYQNEVYRVLSQYTDTPLVFVGAEGESMAHVYGYLGTWEVPLTELNVPAMIEVKGLI